MEKIALETLRKSQKSIKTGQNHITLMTKGYFGEKCIRTKGHQDKRATGQKGIRKPYKISKNQSKEGKIT